MPASKTLAASTFASGALLCRGSTDALHFERRECRSDRRSADGSESPARIARVSLYADHTSITKNKTRLIRTTAKRRDFVSSRAISDESGFRSVRSSRATMAAGAFFAFVITTAYRPGWSTMRRNRLLRASGESASVSCFLPRLNRRNSSRGSNST